MKQFNAVKKLLIVALLGVASSASGQIHPYAFGPQTIGGTATSSNWYKDYVGLRFEVTTPAAIAGDKAYTAAWSGATPWGAPVTTPLVNVPIIMDSTADSFGCTSFPYSMGGKIAVIWRGPLGGGACEFGLKALNAQTAGAVAVVLINEYPGMGPIGMAAGASGGGVTIPVFMVGNLDGMAISGQYRAGVPVKMTITPWGLGNRNDMGFVPGGVAGWHAFAIPADQLVSSGNPVAYKGLDGAFVANYGTSAGVNVKVAGALYFTPNGGLQNLIYTDTTAAEANFNAIDSIYAIFASNEYNFAPTGTPGKGRFDLKYTIMSDTVDQYPLDNTTTVSFYTTDSVYSKSRYDFVKNAPIATIFEGIGGTTPPDYTWGPMYYVAHGGKGISSVQFSIYNPNGTLGPITSGPMNLFVFKWVDGSGGQPHDSLVENGEFQLVSQGVYAFNGTTDTSGVVFKARMGDPGTGSITNPIVLDSNSWYYVAAEVPATYFLGCDGYLDPYPRVYGRANHAGYIEYSGVEWPGDYNSGTNTMTASPASATAPCPFGETAYVNSIDSFNYSSMKGLIPSIALIVKDTARSHVAVTSVKAFADVSLSPNPASEYINVSISLDHPATTVTYTIIDGLGRFVSKESHNNISSETYKMSTANLAPGNYYLVVNANGQALSRKFVIVR